MKRAAAIVGRTPSFVRWSIGYGCSFRQDEEDHLPDPTFRKLRSLREISTGFLESRIVDDFCIHPELNDFPENARGFPMDEVLPFFGGLDQIRTNCENCFANVAIHKSTLHSTKKKSDQKVWAGCFGWLRSQDDQIDLIDSFQELAIANEFQFERHEFNLDSRSTNRIWFQIWQRQNWNGKNLHHLQKLISLFPDYLIDEVSELFEFRNAVEACVENRLALMTELIPAGNSDGIGWKIEPHCSICRCEMTDNERQCGECGNSGHPVPARIKKVLGLRPYMLLKDLIGGNATELLLAKYHRKQNQ